MQTITRMQIEELKTHFRGDILSPGDTGYDEVRQIWNAMIDRKPGLIARCKSPGDVVAAVKFGRQHGLLVAVRGGGHNIAGNAICNDGLMIDLSLMKAVRVDPDAGEVSVEPGCTLGELDSATQVHGLSTPVGINSTTGVAGLTLGGGYGWLSRKYGLSVDNLLAAEVVLADGSQVRASAAENPDLFWGLRGGGGNFGIVTSFEFQLHPVGPGVLSGLLVFPFDQAKVVLTRYARFSETVPDDLNVWTVIRKAPPLPFLPEEVHGTGIVALAICYLGDQEEGEKLIGAMRKFGDPLGEHIGVQPFTDWQQAFDPLLTPGARNYWKSHNFQTLVDGALDAIIEYAGKLPSADSEIFIGMLGGAAGRVAPDAMAYSSRDARYFLNVHCRWESESEDERCIAWAREFFNSARPFASAGAYVNFMSADEGDRVEFAYGAAYDRLVKLKRKYDPANFFRMNQNIRPA